MSHAERMNVEPNGRKPGKKEDSEEDETPVVIPSSAVTMHPNEGDPMPTPSVEFLIK